MIKTEILSQIKKAEEDARSMTLAAEEARAKKIGEAKGQARELISKAEKEAAKIHDSKIAESKAQIHAEKEKILKTGISEAESIKKKANKNVAKAAEYVVEQFERTIHA